MTNLNQEVSASLSKISAINESIVKLQEEAKTARKAAIQPFLEALAASGKVSLIVVWGWTPSFNDGEPCEHSCEWAVNIKQAVRNDVFEHDITLGDVLDELGEQMNWRDDAANAEKALTAGHIYEPPSEDILSAISDVIVDTVEEERGTNYYVAYVLKDGKFEVFEDEYDCGY